MFESLQRFFPLTYLWVAQEHVYRIGFFSKHQMWVNIRLRPLEVSYLWLFTASMLEFQNTQFLLMKFVYITFFSNGIFFSFFWKMRKSLENFFCLFSSWLADGRHLISLSLFSFLTEWFYLSGLGLRKIANLVFSKSENSDITKIQHYLTFLRKIQGASKKSLQRLLSHLSFTPSFRAINLI